MLSKPASFARDRSGVAALEFAFVLPTMLLFIVGVFDISKALILDQEVYNAAHTIPDIASSLAVQPDKSTTLTKQQAQQAMSAIYAEMPWVRDGIETGEKSVTMTSVVFTQTSPTCDPTKSYCYAPQVAWSVAYSGAGGGFSTKLRSCGQLNQTTPTGGADSDLGSLRTANITYPDPILVVDVHYKYTPFFFNFITGPVDFWASGYWPVRSVAPNTAPDLQYTTYDLPSGPGTAGKCPGYD